MMSSTVGDFLHFASFRRALLGLAAGGAVVLALWSGSVSAEVVRQVALTAKQVEGFIAAFKPMSPLFEKLARGAKADPKLQATVESSLKKYGFSGIDEYDAVANSISAVLGGVDPKTRRYSDPIALLKKEIAEVQADKSMSAAERKKALQELNAELAEAQPVQHPGNIQLVLKYYDQLNAILPPEQPQPPPGPPQKKK